MFPIVKREKEALIWASATASSGAGDNRKKTNRLDKQSRDILGKGYSKEKHGAGGQLKKAKNFKMLTGNAPLALPKRPVNTDLQKVMTIKAISWNYCHDVESSNLRTL